MYREFTRISVEKVPDAKTLGRPAQTLGPEVIERLPARFVARAQDRGVVSGGRMPVDTTVAETNIHYPTDSSLMGDGVRVLTPLPYQTLPENRLLRRKVARTACRPRDRHKRKMPL